MELSQRVIVIAHAGKGIEQSLALYLANQGANLALIDQDPLALAETMNLCLGSRGQVHTYVVPGKDYPVVKATFRQIVRDFGHIDVFIDSLGISEDGHLIRAALGAPALAVDATPDRVLDDALFHSLVYCRQAAIQMMNSAGRGLIVNLLGKHNKNSRFYSHYRQARSELEKVIGSWSERLVPHQIRVMGVVPEFTLHPHNELDSPSLQRIGVPPAQRGKTLAEVVVSLIDQKDSGSLIDLGRSRIAVAV